MPAVREIMVEAGVMVDDADAEGRWGEGAALAKRHGAATVRYVTAPALLGAMREPWMQRAYYMWLANDEWMLGGRGARHVGLLRAVFTDNETSVRVSSLFSLLQLRLRGRIEAALCTQPF